MAHFAKVESNRVTQVLVVSDTDAVNGQTFLAEVLGLGGTWIQTSYNTRGNVHALSGTPLRGNYAGIGYIYDSVNDVFYPPQPYSSWSVSLSTNWLWSPPVPYPTDGKMYSWDETSTNWVAVSS